MSGTSRSRALCAGECQKRGSPSLCRPYRACVFWGCLPRVPSGFAALHPGLRSGGPSGLCYDRRPIYMDRLYRLPRVKPRDIRTVSSDAHSRWSVPMDKTAVRTQKRKGAKSPPPLVCRHTPRSGKEHGQGLGHHGRLVFSFYLDGVLGGDEDAAPTLFLHVF